MEEDLSRDGLRDDQGTDSRDDPGEWLSVAEAARRLGVVPKAIRNRIARGTLRWRPKGNQGREVFVPDDAEPEGDGPRDSSDLVALQVQIARLEEQIAATKAIASAEVEAMRKQLESGLKAMEAGITARKALIEELKAGLEHERKERAKLAGELAEAHARASKGWLERVLEAVRRRPVAR
jgi:hypothetical protein